MHDCQRFTVWLKGDESRFIRQTQERCKAYGQRTKLVVNKNEEQVLGLLITIQANLIRAHCNGK